eukprot:774672-Alexandrium_andersonii.AAC.1
MCIRDRSSLLGWAPAHRDACTAAVQTAWSGLEWFGVFFCRPHTVLSVFSLKAPSWDLHIVERPQCNPQSAEG